MWKKHWDFVAEQVTAKERLQESSSGQVGKGLGQRTHTEATSKITAMKSSPKHLFLLHFLLISCVPGLETKLQKYYQYFNGYYTWKEAQSYCRSLPDYFDLASFFSVGELFIPQYQEFSAWILVNPGAAVDTSYNSGNEINVVPDSSATISEYCPYVTYPDKRVSEAYCNMRFFAICEEKTLHKYKYEFVPMTMTHAEAQVTCKAKKKELALYGRTPWYGDPDEDGEITPMEGWPAWIGLHRSDPNDVTWQWGEQPSDFSNWASNMPGATGDCVSIFSTDRGWSNHNCSSRFPFICIKYNVILVEEKKNWEEALEHCRNLHNELLIVQPDELGVLLTKMEPFGANEVWVGIRFLGGNWWMVDGTDVMPYNLPSCPARWQNCGALTLDGVMMARDCQEQMSFFCFSW